MRSQLHANQIAVTIESGLEDKEEDDNDYEDNNDYDEGVDWMQQWKCRNWKDGDMLIYIVMSPRSEKGVILSLLMVLAVLAGLYFYFLSS